MTGSVCWIITVLFTMAYRLSPGGLMNFRVLQEDVTLSGYRIPAGVS